MIVKSKVAVGGFASPDYLRLPDSLVCEPVRDEIKKLCVTTPNGCFVEVGVYKGGLALELYEIALEQKRDLHLFDTFCGIPCKTTGDAHNIGDFSDVNVEDIKALMPHANFHIGVFPDTLPPELKDIAFSHIDCDQYQSIKDCCQHLWDRMVSGGIMWFDDYPVIDSAKKAVDEYFKPDQILKAEQGNKVYVVKP